MYRLKEVLIVLACVVMTFSSIYVFAQPVSKSTRVKLISGEQDNKGYHTRVTAIRDLKKGVPLSDAEQSALFDFLKNRQRTGREPAERSYLNI